MQLRNSIIAIIVILIVPIVAEAAMSSTNYYIYSDSIGVNGGSFSTSTNYSVADTIGEGPVGTISSASYDLRGGFQNMERGTVSISVTTSSLQLGDLTSFAVNSATTTVIVTSEAASGYTLTVGTLSGTAQAGVADGVVTAGADEYGVAVGGDNFAYADDQSVQVGRILASTSSPTYNATTTLTFKASYSQDTAPQTFNQTITLLVTAN